LLNAASFRGSLLNIKRGYGRLFLLSRMALRFYVCLLLLAPLSVGFVSGCGSVDSPRSASEQQKRKEKLVDLRRQKEDVLYEVELRQQEMDQMETSIKRPGVVGVSDEWLKRHDQLREEIIHLKVKLHDLDLQIADLSSSH
jgi:hypothetical protein